MRPRSEYLDRAGFRFRRFAANQVPKCLALQQLHCDKGPAIHLINFVDGADIRVVQGSWGFGFPLKRLSACASRASSSGRNFRATSAPSLRSLRVVYHAHSPAAELLHNAVMRDSLADHAQECYGGSMDKSMKAEYLTISQKVVGVTSPLHSQPPPNAAQRRLPEVVLCWNALYKCSFGEPKECIEERTGEADDSTVRN